MRRVTKSTGCRFGWLALTVSTRIMVAAALTVAMGAGVATAGAGMFSGSHIGQLAAVSCSSANGCTAVGDYVPGFDHPQPSVAMAYRYSDGRWARQAPHAGSGAGLRAVACASGKSCLAVGADGAKPVVERWNGSRWMRQSPPEAASGALDGVSCPSPNDCIAVGSSQGSAWAWGWNGSAWRSQPMPIVPGSYLDGVACPSATVCLAVGARSNGPNKAVLVERWNGSAWAEENAPSPEPRSGGPHLAGVSCPTVRSCTAVGSDGFGVLVESWNGSIWTRETAPYGARNAVLSGVSCVSAKRCIAVGQRNFKPLGVLAERWNGERWSLSNAETPASSHGQGAALLGVSCPSATACVAVGAGGDFADNVETLIAERWNGTRWHLQ